MKNNEKKLATKNTLLDINFEERNKAKKAAGKLKNGENAIFFDKESKYWYAKPGADLDKLSKWLHDPYKYDNSVKNNPAVEFGTVLEAEGFELDGLPVMDGTKQRVRTLEDKKGQKTGVYVGYLDGVPAGWYLDYRKHDSAVKWVSTENTLSKKEQAHMRITLAQKKLEREEEKQKKYAHIGKRTSQVYSFMPDADNSHAYLEKKGIEAYPGIKVDKKNRIVIPLKNEDGEIRTLQRINEQGFKSFKKNGQKSGSYFVVGGELKDGDPIFYAEGYSTAASIRQSINMPVVMAVDAGNLPHVGSKLKNSYPNSLHIFCGDNDHSKEENKGKIKAKEGAKVTDGIYILPEFTQEEKDKGFTDFNDLHQSRGLDSIRIQIESGIDKYIKKAEMMNDNENQSIQAAPIITEDFEKEMDAALNIQSKEPQAQVETFTHTEEKRELSSAEEPEKQKQETPTQNQIQTQETPQLVPTFDSEEQAAFDKYIEELAQENQKQPEPQKTKSVIVDVDTNTKELESQPIQHVQPKPEQIKEKSQEIQTEENSIEPYIQNEKSQETDEEAKAWLTSRRTSITEMIAEDNTRERDNKTLNPSIDEKNREIIKPKIQQTEQDYFSNNDKFEFVVPERVSKSYIEVEGKYYFQNRPDSLAFVDKGAKLQTKLNNHQVADSMVEIAEARGWSEIQVKGTEDFRREVWLQATTKGLTAHGYKPKEEDLARLKKLSNERGINEIESRELADDVKQFQANQKNSSENDRTKQTQINNDTQKQEATVNASNSVSVEKVNKLAGKLIEHGSAPYEHQEGNQSSYFVTLENSDGKQSKTWGVDLKRAITESEAQKGDYVELENLGRKPVTVKKDIQDKDGNVIKNEEINTFRNKWEVKAEAIRDKDRPAKEIVKEHPDLINEITAVKLAEKVSQNMNTNDQERFMDRVRDKLADKVVNGEKSPEIKVKETRIINHQNVKEPEAIER